MNNFQDCTILSSALQRISLDKEGALPLLDEYRQQLHDILYGETGPLEAERILHENAFIFHEAAAIEKDPEKARLYRLAGHLTKIALQQNRKREAVPLKPTDKRIPGTPSSLVWTGTKAELYELIVALYGSGVVSDASGQQMNFTMFVKTLCLIFNVDSGSPTDIKRSILSRKTRLTAFIDRLKSILEATK